jgi:hypothetical protein
MWLASHRGNVLEVSVIVHDHRPMMLGDGGREQVDDPGCAVMSARGQLNLHLACPLCDCLANGQHNIFLSPELGDGLCIGEVRS